MRPEHQDSEMSKQLDGKTMSPVAIAAEPLLRQYSALRKDALAGDKAVAELPKLLIDSLPEGAGQGRKPLEVKLADGSTSQVEFYESGKIKSAHITRPNGDTKDITYSELGKPVSLTVKEGQTETKYAYADGRLQSKDVTFGDRSVEHVEYAGGKVVLARSVRPDGSTVQQEYDPAANQAPGAEQIPTAITITTKTGVTDRYYKEAGANKGWTQYPGDHRHHPLPDDWQKRRPPQGPVEMAYEAKRSV